MSSNKNIQLAHCQRTFNPLEWNLFSSITFACDRIYVQAYCTLTAKLRRNSKRSRAQGLQLMLTVDRDTREFLYARAPRRIGPVVNTSRPAGSYQIPVYRPELRKQSFWTSPSTLVFSVAVDFSKCIVVHAHAFALMHCVAISNSI